MNDQPEQEQAAGLAERGRKLLIGIAEFLFMIAFFLFCFKLFWFLVEKFTMPMLDIILAWPTWVRMLVGLPLIAIPVLLAGYLVFGDEEKPGWLVALNLRKHPVVKSWFGLFRSGMAVIGSFAFLKLIWLSGMGRENPLEWPQLFGELLKGF